MLWPSGCAARLKSGQIAGVIVEDRGLAPLDGLRLRLRAGLRSVTLARICSVISFLFEVWPMVWYGLTRRNDVYVD